MVNVQHIFEFSSQWIIFIKKEFSSPWWISITMKNFHLRVKSFILEWRVFISDAFHWWWITSTKEWIFITKGMIAHYLINVHDIDAFSKKKKEKKKGWNYRMINVYKCDEIPLHWCTLSKLFHQSDFITM